MALGELPFEQNLKPQSRVLGLVKSLYNLVTSHIKRQAASLLIFKTDGIACCRVYAEELSALRLYCLYHKHRCGVVVISALAVLRIKNCPSEFWSSWWR